MGGGTASNPQFEEQLPKNLAQSKTTRNHLNQKQLVKSIDHPESFSPDHRMKESMIQEQFRQTKKIRGKLKHTFISKPSGNKIGRLHPPPA
mmetsp:Transcript_21619/g.33267  ORF Transcript_21619/g.33267 Transcript_21619/m.33267 type:complete len:91 (+) Transcript_21619:356-628(+)